MCLVRGWSLGLLAKAAALWLSHQMTRVEIREIPISVSKDLSHKTSDAAIARA